MREVIGTGWLLVLGLSWAAAGCRQEAKEAGVQVERIAEETASRAGVHPASKKQRRVGTETTATPPAAKARAGTVGRTGSAIEVQGATGNQPSAPSNESGRDEEWVWEPPARQGKRGGGRQHPPSIDIEACQRYGRQACRCRDPKRGEALCAGAVEVLRTWKRMLEWPEESRLTREERAQGGRRSLEPTRQAIEQQAEEACKEGLREVRRLCRNEAAGSD